MASFAEGTVGRPTWRLSWSAVIAGALLAIAVHIVLGLVGAALGFAAAPADSKGLGAGAAAWALLTPFVASLVGAWVACRMAAAEDQATGNLHGVVVWGIGLIAGALFLTGTLASGAMTAGTAASGNAGAAQRALRGDTTASARGAAAPDRGTPASAQARARGEDAARAAAAASGAGALASVAGLLGALAGSGLSRRRREGRGWSISLLRRGEHGHGAPMTGATPQAGDRGTHAGGTYTTGTETRFPAPGEPSRPGARDPTDPYHHH